MAAKTTAAKATPTSFILSRETKDMIDKLADHHNLSNVAVVELAIRELDKRRKEKDA